MRAGSFTVGTLMKQLRPCATLIQAPDKVNARWMIGKRESSGPAEHCMKTLFLIRHAKSSWDDPALPDKDRPLGDRGRRDAPKMGKRLAKRDVKPDLILSSPARRALKTAEIIAKKLDYKLKDIVVDDRLYTGAVHDLLNRPPSARLGYPDRHVGTRRQRGHNHHHDPRPLRRGWRIALNPRGPS